jgi:hypothetical protein
LFWSINLFLDRFLLFFFLCIFCWLFSLLSQFNILFSSSLLICSGRPNWSSLRSIYWCLGWTMMILSGISIWLFCSCWLSELFGRLFSSACFILLFARLFLFPLNARLFLLLADPFSFLFL